MHLEDDRWIKEHEELHAMLLYWPLYELTGRTESCTIWNGAGNKGEGGLGCGVS